MHTLNTSFLVIIRVRVGSKMNWRNVFAFVAIVLVTGLAVQASAVFVVKHSSRVFDRESVEIIPANASLRVGEAQQFTLRHYVNGQLVKNTFVNWSVSGPQATISSEGLLTAVSEGNVVVTASTPRLAADPQEIVPWRRLINATASVKITSNGSLQANIDHYPHTRGDFQRIPGIDAGRVSVEINTSVSKISSGDEITLNAVARDGLGAVIPNASFDWTTSDSDVLYFNSTSNNTQTVSLVARKAGNATITARLCNATASGSHAFTVVHGGADHFVITPENPTVVAGNPLQFTALAYDAAGNAFEFNEAWGVEPGTGDGVIDVNGRFTGTRVGTATVVVRGVSFRGFTLQFYGYANTTVNIAAGNISSISLSPSNASIKSNESVEFVATARNSYGQPIPVSLAWTVSNSSVAELVVNSSNNSVATVRGRAVGTAVVSVAAGDKVANATVTVSPGTVDHYVITPNPIVLRAGTTQQLSVATADAYGNIVSQIPLEWLVFLNWTVVNSNGSTASVSNTGLLDAGNATGLFTVTASFANTTGSASGTIVLGQVANVTLSSDCSTVVANDSSPGAHLTVTAADVFGNSAIVPSTFAGNLSASFTVSNGTGGGRVTADGSFYGLRAGNVTVTATVENASASTTLNVVSSALSRIVVNASASSMRAGEGVQFTAIGYDALNNAVEITPYWNVVSGSGSINASGYFTSTVAGQVVVSASVANTSGTANLTVNPANLHHIGFDPDEVTVEAGEYVTFKANGYDQYGNNVTAPPLVYSLRGGTGTAEITSAGVFIGHKAGTVTVRADAPSDSSLSATLRVTIVGGEAQRLEIVSATGQFKLREGESIRLSVTGYDAYDNPTGAGEVFWDVSDPSIASITQDGTLTGNNAGIVTVYAYRGAANASHAFNVMPSAKPFNLIPAGSLGQTGTEARVIGPSNVVAESTESRKEVPATASGTGLFSAASFPWLAGALVLIVLVAVVAYTVARNKAEEESRKLHLPQKIPAWAKPPLDAEPVEAKKE